MVYLFTVAFVALGVYCIIKGIRLRIHLDPNSDDYKEMRKKSVGIICGGVLLILIGLWKAYTRIVLWEWG